MHIVAMAPMDVRLPITEHVSPVKPTAHVQVKLTLVFEHWPPFWQGELAQGSTVNTITFKIIIILKQSFTNSI
jgi:hypothetical protein